MSPAGTCSICGEYIDPRHSTIHAFLRPYEHGYVRISPADEVQGSPLPTIRAVVPDELIFLVPISGSVCVFTTKRCLDLYQHIESVCSGSAAFNGVIYRARNDSEYMKALGLHMRDGFRIWMSRLCLDEETYDIYELILQTLREGTTGEIGPIVRALRESLRRTAELFDLPIFWETAP